MYEKKVSTVSVEITPSQLSQIKKVLGLHFSVKAKSLKPSSIIECLFRAIEKNQLTNNYYDT